MLCSADFLLTEMSKHNRKSSAMESYLEGTTGTCPQQTAKYNPSSNLEQKYIKPLLKIFHMMPNQATCCRKDRSTILHRSLGKLGLFTA